MNDDPRPDTVARKRRAVKRIARGCEAAETSRSESYRGGIRRDPDLVLTVATVELVSVALGSQ